MLMDDAIDFTGNTVMMNLDRVSAVKFTTPVLYASYRVFLRQPEQQIKVSWTSFLRPFSRTLWLAISVYFMGLSLLLFYCTPFCNENLKFKDTIFYVFIISCNQGLVAPPRNSFAQMLLLSASLTTVVIMAAYSAGLVSSLAAKDQRLPFTTLQELLDEGSHQFGTVDHSAEKELFIVSHISNIRVEM
uniref:(California timema) hypothetical protein n=1 Tax=Timema californicum TaxID=61474 RepID=A0A7R9JHM9_TIMCA|nr:unnamed protein product [Timema californicum]